MPAYVVALIETVTDMEAYKLYVAQVDETLRPFGGRFLARKPGPEVLEGHYTPSRAIILQFPDEASARAWHASPAYQPVMRLRQSASRGTLLFLPASDARVPLHEVCYVELVSADVAGMRRLCEGLHGWRFDAPDAALGNAVVATLPSGARCAIRASLHEMEKPLTRAYVRVADVEAAAKRAGELGALVALPPVDLEGHGRIAIVIHGGIEHGLWQLP